MILIADSGSTKTDWVLCDMYAILKTFKTQGLNPYYVSQEEVKSVLENGIGNEAFFKDISEVYFYGAGCSAPQKKEIINSGIQALLKNARIEVSTDLMGAALALFGKGSGIAAILGTGSNICLFEGGMITQNPVSLGYIFGDEGSGSYMGKKLAEAFLRDKLPKEIEIAFNEYFHFSKADILNHIYKEKYPNRFLASFCYFIRDYQDNQYLTQLINSSFDDFIEHQASLIPDYNTRTWGVIGSIGFEFKNQLMASLNKYHIRVDKILLSPIDGLIDYHQKNKSES